MAMLCGECVVQPNKSSQLCRFDGCNTRASFNLPGQKVGKYCATHKLEDMINVKHKTCAHEGCKTLPTYNLPGQKVAIYCATHKSEDMVNVINKTCAHDGCKKQPVYNAPGQKVAIYCATHKLDNMINVKAKTCAQEGCQKIPAFNFPGQKVAIYCSTHKLDNMINVVSKTCTHDGCKKQPVYNAPGQNVAIYCATHKLDNMIDVKTPHCKSGKTICENKANPTRFGYCLHCFNNLPEFKDHILTKNYKNKERSVADFVCSRYPMYDWVLDHRVNDGCSLRRPDILCDFGSHLVLVEVDENQHKQYNTTCEHRRIMELSQDVNHRPIVFIRFNPDGYTVNGQHIPSPWSRHRATGHMRVGKNKEKEWESRLNALKECIEQHSQTVPEKMVSEHKLFYDDDKDEDDENDEACV